jgi:recombination protein RecT
LETSQTKREQQNILEISSTVTFAVDDEYQKVIYFTIRFVMKNQIKKQTSLKQIIASDKMKEQFAAALPQHLTAERFCRVAITALTRTPKLQQCSQESFFKCLLDLSAMGLEPDGRRAHLIPYGKEATLIIDWKGLVDLAKRSGEVATWKAETVKENDDFEWINGEIQHRINWREDRGKLDCVYSIVKTKEGDIDTEVMTLSEVEAIRNRSKAGKSGPWVTDFEEMAKKTVLRRHSKRLSLSPEFHTALEKDHDQLDFTRNVSPQTVNVDVNPFEEKPDPEPQPEPEPQSDGDDIPWEVES